MAKENKSGESRKEGSEGKEGKGGKGKAPEKQEAPVPVPRLQTRYLNEIRPKLREEFKLSNINAVPRLRKICLNMGVGKAATENNPKLLEQCVADLSTITGQRAVMTLAKKSVSNFKLRQGMKIGCRVTLRGARMYEFFDRLINVVIPRIRDFRGLQPKSFDGRGNYSMGLQEQTVFPEIDADKVEAVCGMDITVCTSAPNDELARGLLKAFGMPFRDR